MARVLVTGMSGAGKTTLLQEVAARGYLTVDTDYDGWTLSNGYTREVEPLLRRSATVELDGRRPVAELADVVEKLLRR
jgi:dephospho-CoA kinase